MAESHSFCPGHLSLMDMRRLRIASVTALEWEASSCHIGGSLGLTARDLADVRRLLLALMRFLPPCVCVCVVFEWMYMYLYKCVCMYVSDCTCMCEDC